MHRKGGLKRNQNRPSLSSNEIKAKAAMNLIPKKHQKLVKNTVSGLSQGKMPDANMAKQIAKQSLNTAFQKLNVSEADKKAIMQLLSKYL